MQNTPSSDELDALFKALKDVVMNPKFQSVIAEIQGLSSPSERSQAISTRLTPEALTHEGILIPKEFTTTTYVLQNSSTIEAGNADWVSTSIGFYLGFAIFCIKFR